MNTPNRPPTPEECTANKVVTFDSGSGDSLPWLATWYPQMGGYVGKCWVFVGGGPDSCFDALVYHDGEFPFDDRTPKLLHHCSAEQFRDFANEVEKAQGRY